MVEHLAGSQKVTGSTPVSSTTIRDDGKSGCPPRESAGEVMTRKLIVALCLILASVYLTVRGPSQETYLPSSSLVYRLKITTEVDNILATYVARAIAMAEREGARLIIAEINTPGGEMGGMWKISDSLVSSLVSSKIPTVAWVNKNGASAGAMITYACKYIVMAPGGTFGACVPVMLIPMEGPKLLPEKYVSYTRDQIRSVATATGHSADIAAAMVDQDIELKFSDIIPPERLERLRRILRQWDEATPEERAEFKWFLDSSGELPEEKRDELRDFLVEGAKIIEKGKILTLDTDKAFLLNVAIGKAATLAEIFDLKEIRELNLGRPLVKTVNWSWSELAARFLSMPLVSSLLLIGGIVGIATELKVPGFGFPGILGISCIVLLFFGNFAAGAAQWTDLILFGLGVAFLLIEIFVIPGFGFMGIFGIMLIVVSIFMMLLKSPGPDLPASREDVLRVIRAMSASIIAAAVLIYILFQFLSPRMPLFGRLVLASSQRAQEGYTAGDKFAAQADQLLGKVGVARSMLRPAGKAVFEGKLFDVVTEGDIIEKESKIEIIEVRGNRIVVQKVKES